MINEGVGRVMQDFGSSFDCFDAIDLYKTDCECCECNCDCNCDCDCNFWKLYLFIYSYPETLG